MNSNKLFLFVLILSILFFISQVTYLQYIKFLDVLIFAILFAPVVFVFTFFLFHKNNKWKIFCHIASFLILSWQIFIFCALFMLDYMSVHNNWYYQKYNNAADYQIAKRKINCQKCIRHFPKEIPQNANNIVFSQYQSYWWGSETIFLKFEIDKKYIEEEVLKYNKNNLGKNRPQQVFPFDISDFEFFTIFNKFKRFLKEGGIGIDYKNNTVLYYYNSPDD